MNRKGLLLAYVVTFVFIAITCLIILLILPNLLFVWRSVAEAPGLDLVIRPPVTIDVIFKPEYYPLTADHALYSLLASTDVKTGKSVQELLAYASFYGSTEFDLEGEPPSILRVNVGNIVDSKMKFLVPDKDYSLIISPNIRIGKSFESEYTSISTLTLPNLEKAKIILYLG
jgi:hypothetical protein